LGIASLIAETVYLILLVALGLPIEFFPAFFTKVIPAALYAVCIAVLVFPLVTKFLRRAMKTEPNTVKRIA
ncbi:MAG: hypothetical protein FWF11_00110, partial [Coriobacteriia bacterium]|nr:hypothetical protein [Coriobacteriia bacterium]